MQFRCITHTVLTNETQERERYICYCHKPIVKRWTTPSHHGDGGDVNGEGGGLSGRAPPEFSPSNLQPPDLCFLVSLVWRLSSGKTSGDLLYSRF